MPSSALPSERHGEASQGIAEGEQPQSDVNEADRQEPQTDARQHVPAGEGQNRAQRYYDRAYKRARRCEAWIRHHRPAVEAIAAAVIATFTVALFFTSLWQWQTTKTSVADAKTAADQNRNATVATQAARVGVESVSYNCKAGDLMYKLKNAGHVPATEIYTKVMETRRTGDNFTPISHTLNTSGGSELFPGGFPLVIRAPLKDFQARECQALGDGTETIITAITITYEDGFGAVRKNHFAFAYNAAHDWISVPIGTQAESQRFEELLRDENTR